MKKYIKADVVYLSDEGLAFQQRLVDDDNTSSRCLDRLAHSKYSSIREAIADHPNVSIDTLLYLSWDENDAVRLAAEAACQRRAYYSRDPQVLSKLADHYNECILRAVAQNLNTPKDVLIRLADYSEFFVNSAAKFYLNKRFPGEAI